MPKKECPNGHMYDPSIYGDQCPMCPPPGAAFNPMSSPTMHTDAGGLKTSIATPGMGGFAAPTVGATSIANDGPAPNIGQTKVRPQDAEPVQPTNHTVIRHVNGAANAQATPGRKLVGFLVTYNRNPLGKAYNLYEGRNYIGRDRSCDICIDDDPQISSKHMSILYRAVDQKFKFRDEQSSNGTFVNKQLLDDGTLENFDIIRVGGTIFVFLAIPLAN